MRPVKIFGGVFIALVVVVGIALFIGLKNLNSLVEVAIESVGSNVTKTEVSVGNVDIDVMDGRGEINNISVKNPPGYKTQSAMDLGKITVQLEPASLAKSVIIINELTIDGAKLTAEHKGLADINLQQLYDNIRKASGKSVGDNSPTTARPDLRFMVENAQFTDLSLDLISEEYGQREVAMQNIQLSNVGSKEQGLSAEELANALLTPVVNAARKQAADELRGKAEEQLKEKLEEKISDDDQQKLEALKSWLDK